MSTSAAQGRTVPFAASRGARPPHARPAASRDVGELAAVVAKEPVRVAVHVADVQIEIAVLVGVEPDGADGLARVGEAQRSGATSVKRRPSFRNIACSADRETRRTDRGRRRRRRRSTTSCRTAPVVDDQPGGRGRVGEPAARRCDRAAAPAAAPVGILAGREADEQIGIAVGVEVAPRRGARRPRVGDARRGRDVREHARVVAIETIRRAVEADEQIEIAVRIEVGPGVDERPAEREEIRLDGLELGRQRRLRQRTGRGQRQRPSLK